MSDDEERRSDGEERRVEDDEDVGGLSDGERMSDVRGRMLDCEGRVSDGKGRMSDSEGGCWMVKEGWWQMVERGNVDGLLDDPEVRVLLVKAAKSTTEEEARVLESGR